MSSRTDHRFYSHYQSHQDTKESAKADSDLILKYLSPTKSRLRNKENVNIYEEVNTLLKKYQQNPMKKKCSLPNNEARMLKEVCNKLRSRQLISSHKGPQSTSPMPQKKSDGATLSPILKSSITSPKTNGMPKDLLKYQQKSFHKQKPMSYRCSFHLNKKAKFFDSEGTTKFYCSDCSIKKLLKGSIIYPIEDYDKYNSRHRNILSDSELVGRKEFNQVPQVSSIIRANFWSLDENSLISSTPPMMFESYPQNKLEYAHKQKGLIQYKYIILLAQDTFESSISEMEMEEQIKQRELAEFVREMEQMKMATEREVEELDSQQWKNRLRVALLELNNMFKAVSRIVNIQIAGMSAQPMAQKVRINQEISKEVSTILSDITSNRDNIISQMQLKPFRFILSKYREKMKGFDAHFTKQAQIQDQITQKTQQLGSAMQYLELIKEQVRSRFGVGSQDLTDIIDLEEDIPSTQRNISKRSARIGIPIENVYISFENKDLFMAAQRASIHGANQLSQFQRTSPELDSELVQVESVDQKRIASENKIRGYMLESPNFLRA